MYARAAHVRTRAAYIFHARWVILRGVDSAPHSRENGGNRDAQSHDPKISNQIKIIKQPPGLLLVGGTRCFEQAMD